ncbi:MAG: molybdopterin molybdotransferase MoeA [Chromatiales bacterium]|jgi:molybdopterin molybdotransferase
MACDDCTTTERQPLRPVDEALEFLLTHAKAVGETETLPCQQALGRVLAEPVKSCVNVPPWNNSAMDGYAIRFADVAEGQRLPVSQRIPAGSNGTPLQSGTAARIFTGAPIPAGADTVVMQEHCEADGDFVVINQLPKDGANVRMAGEDVQLDEVVLQPGTRLQPQHLGLAASVGVAELTVYRRLRVALFSSGDELVMPGESLQAGQIYNSNQFTLSGLLEALDCDVINLGIVEDTFDATCDALAKAAESADLVLASGGVSVGEEDHVKPAVEKLGSLALWKIAIRPGKPLAFGHIGDTPFIGAPGNPVSLFVTFSVFARPFIKKMQGMSTDSKPLVLHAKANFEWTRPDKRREYARARYYINEHGEPLLETYPSRSSGVLSSVTWANGLAVIEAGQIIERGDLVNFIPFSDLLS